MQHDTQQQIAYPCTAKRLKGSIVTNLEVLSFTKDTRSFANINSVSTFGFGFNLQFRGCSFGELELSFHCLGDWEGRAGERYVALMDTGASLTGDRPRYRCGVYKEDPVTGKIKLALSSDSTCLSNLKSPDSGYENLILSPKETPSWPELSSSCMFPDWVQGDWQHIQFHEDTVLYKDHRNFKTYTGKDKPAEKPKSQKAGASNPKPKPPENGRYIRR